MSVEDEIIIINLDMGNVGSIKNMCKKAGIKTKISADETKIKNAKKIILPGVGAFDNAMNKIDELNLRELLDQKVLDEKIPVLGVCLGMQLLMNESEEGMKNGLGWIKGKTIKFELEKLKIPHMGWNDVNIIKKHSITNKMPFDCRFYFVHSYYVKCEDKNDILMETNYGIDFTSAVQKNNIIGVQFHPEKSHKFGLQIYKNFGEI